MIFVLEHIADPINFLNYLKDKNLTEYETKIRVYDSSEYLDILFTYWFPIEYMNDRFGESQMRHVLRVIVLSCFPLIYSP